eukprot:83640_1
MTSWPNRNIRFCSSSIRTHTEERLSKELRHNRHSLHCIPSYSHKQLKRMDHGHKPLLIPFVAYQTLQTSVQIMRVIAFITIGSDSAFLGSKTTTNIDPLIDALF